MRNMSWYRSAIVSLAFLAGCATTVPQEVTLLYPPPPEEPKIAYLGSYRGEVDLRRRTAIDSFLVFLFGTRITIDLRKPYGVSSFGEKIYVADTGTANVLVIDLKERKIGHIGDQGAGKLALPVGVAAAADGTIFVSDAKQKRIIGYDAKGALKIAIGKKDELKNPAGLAVNNELGRLYVADSYGHKVHVYSFGGDPLFQFYGGEGGLYFPTNVAVDRRNGNVYVADTQNFRVQVFDKDGKFMKVFGKLGDSPGSFSRPRGVGVDSDGNIYVADAAFDNFQVFDEKGQLLTYIGGAGNAPGAFYLPAGLYVDEQDRVFVVDSLNYRVQVFQYLSEKWKKEHPEEYRKYLQYGEQGPAAGAGQ